MASAFRGDIQGLRAIAVAAVLLYHAGVPFLTGGYVGVDVFFVISGFLITSHLVSRSTHAAGMRLADFYARRARRVLPAAFVVVALSIVAAIIWYPPLLMPEIWAGAVATALYVPNYLFAVEGTNYLAESTPSLFQHYWSLGIEEQFYIVWPVLLAILLYWIRNRRAQICILFGIVAISFGLCVYLTYHSQSWAFFSLPTRAWELGIGGLAAFALGRREHVLRGPVAAVVGWGGIGAIFGSIVLFSGSTEFPGAWAAVPVLGTVAVILAGTDGARFGPARLLATRPMLFIGLISYSLYLVHWPLLQVTQAAVGFSNELSLAVRLLLVGLSVPIAWALFRFVEQPARSAAWLSSAKPRRSLLLALASSLVLVLVASGTYAVSSTVPLSATAVAASTVIQQDPVGSQFVPSNLRPSLRAASSDQPAPYVDGCHLGFTGSVPQDCVYGDRSMPRIVLFGDSHAAQWFPPLQRFAEERGYAVEIFTKSSCPSVSAQILRSGVPYDECSRWRSAVLKELESAPPALVILSNFGVASIANTGVSYEQAWGDALRTTLSRLTVPTIVIADTPMMGSTPSVCLSNRLDNTGACSTPRQVALGSRTREVESRVAVEGGATYVDLSNYICGPEVCEPILGDTLVYRDSHHLTASFSVQLTQPLGDAIDSVLGTRAGADLVKR